MTLSEMHPTGWGLETDYLHFLAALGWMLDGGLAFFFAAPREGVAMNRAPRVFPWAVATAFLLFGAACGAGVLDTYGHLVADFRGFGLVAETCTTAAVLLGFALLPVPKKVRSFVAVPLVRAALVGASVVFLVVAPRLVSWWLVVAASLSCACMFLVADDESKRPAWRFELSIGRLLGVMFGVVALAWGVPDVLHSFASASDGAASLPRAVGVAQGAVLACGAGLVFLGQWILYLRLFAVPRIRARRGLFGLRPVFALPVFEFVVLVAGFFFAQGNAAKVEGFVDRRMLAEVRARATSIDWNVAYPDAGAPGSLEVAEGLPVRARLERLLDSSVAGSAAVIWEMDHGTPQPLATAGGGAADASPDLVRLLSSPAAALRPEKNQEAAVVWRHVPKPYSWAMVVVPAREFSREHPGWNISLAIDGRGLADPIVAYRLQSLAIVSLVALLVGFGVVHSVRSLSETELRGLKEKAEAENRAKSDFLAMVSHEVRTPLQSVLGFAELAEASHLSESAARHVRAVRSQGAVLLRIVQDILDFSALRSGQLHLVPETVSLRELAIEVQRAFAERAAGKGLVITVDVAENVPTWVMVDRVRLSQVLLNLVGNAVKFTHRGGVRLAVTVAVAGGGVDSVDVEFTVSDTGAGITDAQLRRIFEPFRKLRDDDTPFGGGVGLGLAICRQVVELLGGEIEVESRAGEGATFRFGLVLLLAGGPPPAAPAVPCVVPSATPTALAGLNVLLVDDNPHVRELLREFLRRLGASVVARPDGRSALAAVRARCFDVILLDLRLPDMDAGALASGIRAISGSPLEPWVVGISAGVSDLEIQSALEKGLNDFMLKPVSMAGLAETIRMSPVAARIVVPPGSDALSIEVTPQVRQAFFDETTPVLARIESLCRNNRGHQAAAEAHYLANGCLMLGLDEALALCRDIEKLAEADDLEAAVTVARRLRAVFETPVAPSVSFSD